MKRFEKEAQQLTQKLDRKLISHADRERKVNEILQEDEFISEYLDKYNEVGIKKQDDLHENTPVGRALEKLTDYYLSSEEEKEYSKQKETKYKLFKDRKYFERKLQQQEMLSKITGDNQDQGTEDNVIYFHKKNEKNIKTQKRQKIEKTDLKRKDEIGTVLANYNDYLSGLEKDENMNNYKKGRIKHSVKKDMLYAKDALLGVFGYNITSSNETTDWDYDVFDLSNVDHLKGLSIKDKHNLPHYQPGLLYFQPYLFPDDSFSDVLTDLQLVIKRSGLSEREKIVLNMIRTGFEQKEIAEKINVSQATISRDIDKIADKIAINSGRKEINKDIEEVA